MSDRKLLGDGLPFEEKLALAQLVNQPGWKILVKLMAEACRHATEDVIKVSPTQERRSEVLDTLQCIAHAMHKFSADVLDSVKLHQRVAVKEAQQRENPTAVFEPPQRFRMPIESPAKEPKQNQ